MSSMLTPARTFAAVSFFIGELGDGLNYFQGLYLVGLGWNESAVGLALSLMGFTTLIMQTCAGDIVDKATIDRRLLLSLSALITAGSAMSVMFVREGNQDHMLMYVTKVLEGVASSFLAPCLIALTLANFGPDKFDSVLASNVFWGLVGYALSATLVGLAAYVFYPSIKLCFLVIGVSAVAASAFAKLLPEGNPRVGSGFAAEREANEVENGDHPRNENLLLQTNLRVRDGLDAECETNNDLNDSNHSRNCNLWLQGNPRVGSEFEAERETNEVENGDHDRIESSSLFRRNDAQQASSYWSVFTEKGTLILCLTGFFFHFANCNVVLVLGELMAQGNGNGDAGEAKRNAIPLMAVATLISQFFMCSAVSLGDRFTKQGVGRKTLFLSGIVTLPLRVALIILWRNSGPKFLLITQILDGIEGGLFRVIHPFMVVDLTFGTGRFNVVMGMTNSFFWFGRTCSTLLGQYVVEHFGHSKALFGALIISFVPIIIFGLFMPETLNTRGNNSEPDDSISLTDEKIRDDQYLKMT